MCVAIGQNKGADTLTIEELEEGWESNPDGGGFAYILDGKIKDYHTMDKDDFILTYLQQHEEHGANSPFMVHMRIATHGKVQLSTTHPFRVTHTEGHGEFMFCHNGIIGGMQGFTDDDTSDTMAFRDHILELLPYNWQDEIGFFDMIEEYIGWSKLVMLTTEPDALKQMYIMNEDSGIWMGDTWFSNYSCFDWNYQDYATNTKVEPYDRNKKFGMVSQYVNGKHTETSLDWNVWEDTATPVHKPKDVKFDEWLADGDSEDYVLYSADEIKDAKGEDFMDMLRYANDKGVKCTDCFGIEFCFCPDKCSSCYHMYHTCECDGAFESIHSAMTKLHHPWKEGEVVPF